jgi:flagellar basal-body rod protein FlgB
LEKSLDAAWLRNEVISGNVANADTPGYKRKEVQFEQFLNSEMKNSQIEKGQTRLSGGGGVKVVEDHSSYSYRLDGNNVDMEREMAQMAMNTLRYNTLIQRMNGQFSKLRNVIRGR